MKPFSAEQADADLLLERNADRHASRRAEERVLLADERAAERGEIERQDAARHTARRMRRGVCPAPWLVKTVMNRLSPVRMPLAGAEQRAHDAGALLLAAVAEHRLHLDARRHVHQRACFGHGALAGIELDLDELHVLADRS